MNTISNPPTHDLTPLQLQAERDVEKILAHVEDVRAPPLEALAFSVAINGGNPKCPPFTIQRDEQTLVCFTLAYLRMLFGHDPRPALSRLDALGLLVASRRCGQRHKVRVLDRDHLFVAIKRKDFTRKSAPVKPTMEDYEAVWQEPKYDGLSDAEKYRLAQANALIRIYLGKDFGERLNPKDES